MIPAAAIFAVLPILLIRAGHPAGVAVARLCTVIYIAIRILPFFVRASGIAVGHHVRAKTLNRRELLLAKVEAEEKEFASKQKGGQKAEDEDWDKLESESAGGSTTGEAADKNWKGVIGFFHPFW